MTGPWPGDPAVDEPYTGPPPMLRPQQVLLRPPAVPWQAAPAWQQAVLRFPPPPPQFWTPPPGTPPHDVPRPFLQVMRSRDWAWWRPLLGLLLISVVYVVAVVVVGLLALVTGLAPDLDLLDLVDPAVLLVTNLALIVAVPVVWLAWAAAHGMRIGWSSSVLARLRWRLIPPFTLIALFTLGTGIGLSILLSVLLGEEAVTGPVADYGWLLVVVLLTTPLQSAAEEYLFRGYLSQAIAGWIRGPAAGALVAGVLTAALFSLAHAPGDWPTFLDRFAFGLAASAVVWLTGGLEAAIVLHAVNNVLVFVLAGALGEAVATEEVPDGTGLLFLAVSLLTMAAYVALVGRAARRLRPETHTAAQDLRRPPALLPAPVR
ncbi:CPBP family intramembrane metalloprotease [Blastococcus sp. CT_GayMR20]|uniref:CPBP family intramembrane glutamic endopeptidase n=1 Tax=Blastococcus sp. CT_GayMR20 TaxID=2559609 RepID=UPI001073ED25|nr:CPBP family intramembrane glutamic endopeptidase [Blastococcus sp. CT_GayMR20]TFV87494.1 CPBP family intramembrane metalloprotease [Blastococcus sp. CT_GayMR20]